MPWTRITRRLNLNGVFCYRLVRSTNSVYDSSARSARSRYSSHAGMSLHTEAGGATNLSAQTANLLALLNRIKHSTFLKYSFVGSYAI